MLFDKDTIDKSRTKYISSSPKDNSHSHGSKHSLNQHPILQLQKAIGNQATIQFLKSLSPEHNQPIQRSNNESIDLPVIIERMKAPSFTPEPIQRKSSPNKLPEDVQAKMETAFQADFSDIKVHTNSSQATEVGALAYTQGNNVHFAPGQYNPDTQEGQEIIGHELTHVIQQRENRVQATTQTNGMAINDDPSLEREAELKGKSLSQYQQSPLSTTQYKKRMSNRSTTIQMMYKRKRIDESEKEDEDTKKIKIIDDLMKNEPKEEEHFRRGLRLQYATSLRYKFSDDEEKNKYIENGKTENLDIKINKKKTPSELYSEKGDAEYIAPIGENKDFHHKTYDKDNWVEYVEGQYYYVLKNKIPKEKKKQSIKLFEEAIRYAEALQTLKFRDEKMVILNEEDVSISLFVSKIEKCINELWELTKTYAKDTDSVPKSRLPQWGVVKNGGVGSSVKAFFTRDLQSSLRGSKTTAADKDDIPWKKKILPRRNPSGGKTNYVQGHLLNYDFGGPGASYNLVPLTEAANDTHSGYIEQHLKNEVRKMKRSALDTDSDNEAVKSAKEGSEDYSERSERISSEIEYTVIADDHFGERSGTTDWEKACEKFKEGIGDTEQSMTLFDLVKKAKDKSTVSPKINVKWWNSISEFVNTAIPEKHRKDKSIKDTIQAMTKIHQVWVAEDMYVPKKITCTISRKNWKGETIGTDTVKKIKNEIDNMKVNALCKLE